MGATSSAQFGALLAEGDSMIRSQIRASEAGIPVALPEYSAATQTKSCFVFQVKSVVRSASRSNFIMAYSSLLGE